MYVSLRSGRYTLGRDERPSDIPSGVVAGPTQWTTCSQAVFLQEAGLANSPQLANKLTVYRALKRPSETLQESGSTPLCVIHSSTVAPEWAHGNLCRMITAGTNQGSKGNIAYGT